MNSHKIRLVGGPFGGKVVDDPKYCGGNEIIYRGPKKMSRKRRYELMTDPNYYPQYFMSNQGAPGSFKDFRAIDGMTEARYRICAYPGSIIAWNGVTPTMPCMHPDGSVFYEYVEGSKRDF